jgi:D-xylulose reductase
MQALVLEEAGRLALRDIHVPLDVGPHDVKIAIRVVGICGSDVHYYTHGRIGSFAVNEPMVLGHEASGVVVEAGAMVTTLKVGDRVCMEPGVPDLTSRTSRLGLYNVDPAVTFWATPPVHGVLTPFVVHSAAFTYRIPDNVSFEEAALVEPFAVGLQAAGKAQIRPGDVAVVVGGGAIGIMVALSALAGGCSKVLVADLSASKLNIASSYPGIVPVLIPKDNLAHVVSVETNGWGADVVFEASGNPRAFEGIFNLLRPGGCVVLVGLPVDPVPFDVSAATTKEARIETVFRYANVFDRALQLIAAGKVDLKRLITGRYAFAQSVTAFERAAEARPEDVKIQITLGD